MCCFAKSNTTLVQSTSSIFMLRKKQERDYWCDICEEQIDTIIWFYTCDSCCVTFHVNCVLGDFSRFMPGWIATYQKCRIKTMQTSPGFLPRCYICHTRRAVPFVLNVFYPKKNVFICSLQCLFKTSLCEDLY